MAEPMRIQKVLADAGVASRRSAEELVAAGRVAVNGTPAVIGQRVDPDADRILVDGHPLRRRPDRVWLALHKPAGVTSTVSDRHAEWTVLDYVPPDIRKSAARLYPVGRLDQDSEGLLLLTNDGDWAQRVLHPRYEVEREYAIGVRGPLDPEQVKQLTKGILLEEGMATLSGLRAASGVEIERMEALAGRSRGGRLVWYRAVLTQGWRRQLRRMFAAVSAPVERLIRVRIGTLRIDGLASGELRALTSAERDRLVRDAVDPEGAAIAGDAARRPGSAGRRQVAVSIDGPGSSGKSSVGSAAAAAVGYRFCDTGVLYRGLAWLAAERRVAATDGAGLVALIPAMRLSPDEAGRLARVVVADRDITGELHEPRVDRLVSAVAAEPAVRAALLPVQREIAAAGGIVMAGRDIGSVVLPDADLRLWLDVSLGERAARRARQRGLDAASAEGAVVLEDLRRRDATDSGRGTAPLRVPDGALIIDADDLSFDLTVAAVIAAIRSAERQAAATDASQRPSGSRRHRGRRA